jgi:F-type H+-transporting ATPase subunit delta
LHGVGDSFLALSLHEIALRDIVADSTSSVVSGLGGRYATALFDLAKDATSLDGVEASLATFAAAAEQSSDLKALIASPRLSREAATKTIAALAASLGLDGLTSKFLGVLASNRRLSAFGDVKTAFGKLMSTHRGETTADVTSAHALSDAQLTALKAKLKAGLGRDVAIQTRIDPAILGGLVVKVGSKLIDSSLRTKLEALSLHMKA